MIYWVLPTSIVSVGWFLSQPATLLSSIAIAIFALVGLFARGKNRPIKNTKLVLAMYALPIGYVVSTIAHRESLLNTFFGMYGRGFGLFTLTAFSTILFLSAQTNPDIFFSRVLPIFTGLIFAYGLLQALQLDPLPWIDRYDTVNLTLGNSNFSSALFGIISIYFYSQVFVNPDKKKKLLNFLVFVTTFFLIYQTGSLQGYVVAIFEIAIFTYLYLPFSGIRNWKVIRRGYVGLISAGVLGVLAIIGNFFSVFEKFRDSIAIQTNTQARLEFWKIGLKMWRDHPFFGVGIDNFQNWSPLYRSKELIRIDGYALIPDKAHNVFIDHFANGGVFVGLIWIASCVLVFITAFKLLKKNLPDAVRMKVFVLIAMISGYLLQAFISPDQLVLALISYLSTGMILYYFIEYSGKSEQGRTVVRTKNEYRYVWALVLVIYSLFAFKVLEADTKVQNILKGTPTSQQQVEAVINNWTSKRAVEQVVVTRINQSDNCDAITKYSDQILENHPRSSNAWAYKALCSNAEGKLEQAKTEIDQALKFDVVDTYFLGVKAKLEIATENFDLAQVVVSKILFIDPQDIDGQKLQEILNKNSESN